MSILDSTPFETSLELHKRFNPLTRSWVTNLPPPSVHPPTPRPSQGCEDGIQPWNRPPYDFRCALWPEGARTEDKAHSKYSETLVFEDAFAELANGRVIHSSEGLASSYLAETARGKCYAISFSPRHDFTISEMNDTEIRSVLASWLQLYMEVSLENSWIRHIQIFENPGSIAGCTAHHPHAQAWSLSYLPTMAAAILESSMEHAHCGIVNPSAPLLTNGLPCLLLSYVTFELEMHKSGAANSRVTIIGDHFAAVVPFWASSPFETLIMPFQRHISSLAAMTPDETRDLAATIGAITRRMDNLFECSFGYSMEVFQAPVFRPNTSGGTDFSWDAFDQLPAYAPSSVGSSNSCSSDDEFDWADFAQLHIGFHPPKYRGNSAGQPIRGYELFAATQATITPEQAAQRLRDCEDEHYAQALGRWKTYTSEE